MKITKPVLEWTNEVAHKLHPRSKTIRVVEYYYASAGLDDINLEYNRKFGGYSNDHVTEESLTELYEAKRVEFNSDFSITIHR